MLHKETVKPGTLDLIQKLMEDQQFDSFYLVGGTALSLLMGHRQSIDIDLFCSSDFDGESLAKDLKDVYKADINHGKSNYVSGRIGEVDFDFISHKYTSIKPIATIEGIRMMSAEDIAAMKINAIVNSGQRVKDFIDMYYLFKKMSVDDAMGYYCAKYPNVDIDVARSSLLYHQDVDLNVPVLLMDRKLNWNAVAHGIKSAVWEFDNLQHARASYIKMQEAKKDRSKGQGNETGHGF